MVKVGDYCVVVKDSICGTGVVKDIIREKRLRLKMIDGYTVKEGRMIHISTNKRQIESIEERFHKNILDDLGWYDPEEEYIEEVERRMQELDTFLKSIETLDEDDFYCFANFEEIDPIPSDIEVTPETLPRLIWNSKISVKDKRDMMFREEAVLFDPKVYDEAIVAYIDGIVYYDYKGIVDATFKLDQSCDPFDHVSYNMMGSVCGNDSINIRIIDELEFEPDSDDDIQIINIGGEDYQILS